MAQRVFKTRTVVQPTARSVRLRRRSVTRIARISRGFDRLGLAVFVPILGTAFSPEPSFETLRLVLEAGAGKGDVELRLILRLCTQSLLSVAGAARRGA